MSGTDKHMGNKAPLTAAEQYRQTADEHVRTLKDFWKDFLVSGLFVLAAIVIIFACLAWFAANNSVSATGSTISAKGARFTLTANVADGKTGVYDNATLTHLDLADSMLVGDESNLNNTDTKGYLYPGSAGQIKLKIDPYAADLKDIKVSISFNAAMKDGADASLVSNLLKGHILFFTGKEGQFYTGSCFANGNVLTIPASAFKKKGSGETTESHEFTVFWVWPEHLRNLIATGGSSYDANLFADGDVDHSNFLKALNSHKDNFFRNTKPITAGVDNDMDNAYYTTCSNEYDSADDYIGSNVNYVQVRFSAEEVSTAFNFGAEEQ